MENRQNENGFANGKNALGVFLLIFALPVLFINLFLAGQAFFRPGQAPSIFGIKPLVVLSDSMYPSIARGDLIFVRSCNPATLPVGYTDGAIIAFRTEGGDLVTHRIVETAQNHRETVLITRGDNNAALDRAPVLYEQVEGVFVIRFAGLGNIALFAQTPPGLLLVVGLPVFLFILIDWVQSTLEKRRRKRTAAL